MSANFPGSFGQSDSAGSDDDPTRDELYERAQELDIEGRSDMDKDELAAAVEEAEAESDGEGEDAPRATRTDTAEAGRATAADAGRVLRAEQPDYSPTEEGYVGTDPIYQNSSDHKRRPAVDEKVEGAPKDDESTSDEE